MYEAKIITIYNANVFYTSTFCKYFNLNLQRDNLSLMKIITVCFDKREFAKSYTNY